MFELSMLLNWTRYCSSLSAIHLISSVLEGVCSGDNDVEEHYALFRRLGVGIFMKKLLWCCVTWLNRSQVFAKPFVGALNGHADGVSCMVKNPRRLNCLVSASLDGGMQREFPFVMNWSFS